MPTLRKQFQTAFDFVYISANSSEILLYYIFFNTKEIVVGITSCEIQITNFENKTV
jgi:hypothetical protein